MDGQEAGRRPRSLFTILVGKKERGQVSQAEGGDRKKKNPHSSALVPGEIKNKPGPL